MNDGFTGKVAIVTGGGSGIGAETCRQLGALGCAVVVADRNAAGAQLVVDAIVAAGGTAAAIALEVGDPASVERMVAFAEDQFGGLHLAVNNAGIGAGGIPVGDFPIDVWSKVLDVNLHGVFYSLKYEIPAMLRSGGGAIVNIASVLGAVGEAGSAAYVASKHAVIGLTKTAALDYARQGIRVNSVGPGYIDTPLLAGMQPAHRRAVELKHPVDRLGQADEIANLIVFLLSDKASFITGSYHLVDGGLTAI